MTTNQTIDGVPRADLEQFLVYGTLTEESRAAGDRLRAPLDAPALELIEPVAPWFYFVECDDPDYSGLFNHESEAQTQANDHGGSVVKLWNVPPTYKPAAHPQGETPDDDKSHPRFIAGYMAGLHDHKLGQPKAEQVHECQKCNGRGSVPTRHAGEGETAYRDRCKLYAEQPAPVAVVLPERKTWDGLRATACNLKGEAWNACLDEVTRLNTK